MQIPLFGRASGADVSQEGELDVHLTEFMSSCKAPPPLEAVHPDWDTLADIKSLVSDFCTFLKFNSIFLTLHVLYILLRSIFSENSQSLPSSDIIAFI